MNSNDYNRNNGSPNHTLAHMNWGLLVFFYFVWWPLGLVFTILKIVDMQAEKNEQQNGTGWANQFNGQHTGYTPYNYRYRAYTGTAQNTAQNTAPNAVPHPQNVPPEQYARQRANSGPATVPPMPAQQRAAQPNAAPRTSPYTAPYQHLPTQEQEKSARFQKLAIAGLIVLAVLALCTGLPEILNTISWVGYGIASRYDILHVLLPGIIKVIGGIGLAMGAARMNRGRRREKVLATIVGTRSSVPMQELTAASGFGAKKTMQLTQDAINHGLFGPYSYIDMASRTLVVRGAAPQAAATAKPKAETAAKPKDENKYQAILRQLREANDRIPGEEMSAKISQLETLSARIFELAEKSPEKKPQLNKFMDYYLPTALKLLNTYATLDQQGMQGQNISETKASIENAMDLLVKAFAAQLDKLFQDDALDVSGDIAALQSMMSMDGLTDNDFHTTGTAQADPFKKDP